MATQAPTTPQSKSGEEPGSFDPPAETDDDSLILWMLSLTSAQRLEVAQGFADSVAMLRRGKGERGKGGGRVASSP